MRRARSRSPKYLSIGPVLRVVALWVTCLARFLLTDRPLLDVSVPGPSAGTQYTAMLKKEVLQGFLRQIDMSGFDLGTLPCDRLCFLQA